MKHMEVLCDKTGNNLKVRPNVVTYGLCINGWIRNKLGVASASNAERLLRKMVEKQLKPSRKLFTSVINSWAKCGDTKHTAQGAVGVLEFMQKLHDAGDEELKPDTITFTTVLDALRSDPRPKLLHINTQTQTHRQ